MVSECIAWNFGMRSRGLSCTANTDDRKLEDETIRFVIRKKVVRLSNPMSDSTQECKEAGKGSQPSSKSVLNPWSVRCFGAPGLWPMEIHALWGK
jgi:hypothetical protein